MTRSPSSPWRCWRCTLQRARRGSEFRDFTLQRRNLASTARKAAQTSDASYAPSGFRFRSVAANQTSVQSQGRQVSTSRRRPASISSTFVEAPGSPHLDDLHSSQSEYDVRKHLKEWHAQNGMHALNIALPFGSETASSENESMRTNGGDSSQPDDPTSTLEESVSDQQSLEGEEENEFGSLKPGDIVLLEGTSPQDGGELAVFIQWFPPICQFYTLRGQWVHAFSQMVQFVTSIRVGQQDLDRIIPFLPKSVEEGVALREQSKIRDIGIPRDVAAPVLSKMKAFHDDAEEFYRLHAPVLDYAHRLLSHETDLRFGSLKKIARELLKTSCEQFSAAALFAVRKALLVRNIGFTSDRRSHRYTQLFVIQPTEAVRNIRQVSRWVREYQDYRARDALSHLQGGGVQDVSPPVGTSVIKIQQFIEKAKSLITESRAARPRTSMWIGPDSTSVDENQAPGLIKLVRSTDFSAADRSIVEFIKTTCITPEYGRHPKHEALVGFVIRETGMYDEFTESEAGLDGPGNSITHAIQFQFLQEIGVLKPFENRDIGNAYLLLPGCGRSKSLDRLQESINTVDDDAAFSDRMADLRHDWGNLPVYAVDSAETRNVDDGFSIERVVGSDSEYWIRVHVANPTARLGKTHDIARMAAHLTQTLYLPDTHHSMLPFWVSQKFFSLARDRGVLTVSAKVNKDGTVLETDIRPGIVRNVIRMTYKALCNILDGIKEPAPSKIWVGSPKQEDLDPAKEPDPPELTADQENELRIIFDIAHARGVGRWKSGAMSFYSARARLGLSYSGDDFGGSSNGVSDLALPSEAAHFVSGDPAITLNTTPFKVNMRQPNHRSSNHVVEEMMIIANQAAAMWCAERNLPVLYRTNPSGFLDSPGSTSSAGISLDLERSRNDFVVDFFHGYAEPIVEKTGHLPVHWHGLVMELHGPPETSLTPGPSPAMGVSGYCKVTTPIGRYGDMISHWQIESALREEARTGKTLKGSKDEKHLTFNRHQLQGVLPRLRARAKVMSTTVESTHNFWFSMFMYRALYHSKGVLPPTLTLVLVKPKGLYQRGIFVAMIKEWSILTTFTIPIEGFVPFGKDPNIWGRPGDHWEVRPTAVDPYERTVNWAPVRLLHRDEHSFAEMVAKVRR